GLCSTDCSIVSFCSLILVSPSLAVDLNCAERNWRIARAAISLLRLSICENQPAVECSRSASTVSAGLYPKIGGSSLNHIAQSDLLVGNKSGQAHPVRRVFAL